MGGTSVAQSNAARAIVVEVEFGQIYSQTSATIILVTVNTKHAWSAKEYAIRIASLDLKGH